MATLNHQDDTETITNSWFTEAYNRFSTTKSEAMNDFLSAELAALRAYYNGETTADEAAYAITRPISTSPIPPIVSYSAEFDSSITLMRCLAMVLVDAPLSRTQHLITLLCAMEEVPALLHNGEVTGHDDDVNDTTPRGWHPLPYFAMAWGDVYPHNPGQIVRMYPDVAARHHARDLYLKKKDIESQLVAREILNTPFAFRDILHALEREHHPSDDALAPNEATAFWQLKLDFSIPAVTCWMRHNAQRLYDGVVNGGDLERWGRRVLHAEPRHFERPVERWAFWKRRLGEVAEDGPDEFTRDAAGVAVGFMEGVVGDGKPGVMLPSCK